MVEVILNGKVVFVTAKVMNFEQITTGMLLANGFRVLSLSPQR